MTIPTSTPMFVPGTGGPLEIGLLLLIAVLLFGANKIPKLARSTGEAMGEFQKGREKVEQELEEMREGPGSTETAGGSSETSTDASTDTSSETSSETETSTSSDAESASSSSSN